MARGFGAGVLWGLGVAALGLVTWSQLAPPPASVIAAEEAARKAEEQAAAEAERKAAEEAAAKAAAEAAARAEEEAAAKAAAEAAARAEEEKAAAKAAEEAARLAEQHKLDTEAPPASEASTAEAPATEAPATEAPATEAPATAPSAEAPATEAPAAEAKAEPPVVVAEGPAAPEGAEAIAQPAAPGAVEDLPSLTGLDQALTTPDPEAAPGPVEAAPEAPGDVLLQPGQPQGQPAAEGLPQIAPAQDSEPAAPPAPEVAEPAPEATPVPDKAATLQDDQPTLPGSEPLEDKLPTSVMDKDVPGVTVGELPQVGDAPEAEAAPKASPEDLPPVRRFARDFTPEGKPLFAILLRDVGAGGMARADLLSLPFPVSVVIDPLAPDAKAAMADWRAAGQEVVTLANGIPEGAVASDIETTFATLAAILPESVAVIDQDLGGFQDDRPLATLVMPVIEGQGRGLLTYDRGLNAADQIARREGVPSAVIFRRLDAEGERRTTIRRYLDRAAFKAAQEGVVVVIGDTRPETVAAILEWTVEGRAATVSLAPITAVMGR